MVAKEHCRLCTPNSRSAISSYCTPSICCAYTSHNADLRSFQRLLHHPGWHRKRSATSASRSAFSFTGSQDGCPQNRLCHSLRSPALSLTAAPSFPPSTSPSFPSLCHFFLSQGPAIRSPKHLHRPNSTTTPASDPLVGMSAHCSFIRFGGRDRTAVDPGHVTSGKAPILLCFFGEVLHPAYSHHVAAGFIDKTRSSHLSKRASGPCPRFLHFCLVSTGEPKVVSEPLGRL